MKKLLEEFKTFALKGNVLDMAVGVVVGGAFTSIVNSLVADVLTPPAHEVYVVKGEHEYMIPAVDEFLVETSVEGGYLKVRLIEGMRTDV